MSNMCNCPYDTPTDLDYEKDEHLHCGYCKGIVRALNPRPQTGKRTAHRKAVR